MLKLLSFFVLFGLFSKVISQCSVNHTIKNYLDEYRFDFSVPNSISRNCSRFRFHFSAKVGEIITVTCKMSIPPKSRRCATRLLISRSGDDQLRDARMEYCDDTWPIQSYSVGNEMVLSFESDSSLVSLKCDAFASSQDPIICECGGIFDVRSARINDQGGALTDINRFYSHVGLVSAENPDKAFCGGTIINSYWVLTAAQYLVGQSQRDTILRTGMWDNMDPREYIDKTIWRADYDVERSYVHPQYNPSPIVNDIALVRVKGYIRYNLGTGPACVPALYNIFFNIPGTMLDAAGWDSREVSGQSLDIITKTQRKVVNIQKCSKLKGIYVDDKNICTNGTLKSPCDRDSGSGLYWLHPFIGSYQVVGVIGTRIGCEANVVSVSTRIASYIDWIKSVVKGTMCV